MRVVGFVSVLVAGAVLFAQGGAQKPRQTVAVDQKAPPAVDRALRSRVQKFFQAHVEGKFRAADQYVAEDSKDFFFAMQKPRFLSIEIMKITYSNHFTRAQATVNCEEQVNIPGLPPMKMPRTSLWKLVGGQWYWYVDANEPRRTPFGPMKPLSPAGRGSSGPLQLPKGPAINEIQGGVRADKSEVRLSPATASSDEVTISNSLPGWVRMELRMLPVPGLEVKLDRRDVQPGQSAHVSFRFEPTDGLRRPAVTVRVEIEPTGEVIPIRVSFAAPAQTEKPPQ